MMTKNPFKIILITGISVVLFSCSTNRHFERETAHTEGLFGIEETDSANMAELPWQELFSDANLVQLINEGLANNPDLLMAVQRVHMAEAYFAQSKTALLPGINAQAQTNYTRNPESIYPDGPRDVTTYRLGAEASWEVDLWGKLSSVKRAAYADLLSTDAAQKAIQTRLVANIALSYYELAGLDAKLEITRQTVKNNIDLVETIKVLKGSGRVTGAAVVQSEAARYAAEVTIPDLEQQIRETENALSYLLGRVPGAVGRDALENQTASTLLQTGVPAQLLDNRPDVMQAEFAVIAAFEMTNSAKAYFFPALTLTASTGFASSELNELLDPTAFAANVVGGLTAPLFNKRGNRTRLEVAKAQQEEALLGLRSALLNAGQEVNNALGLYETSEKKMALRQQQLEALEKSVEYSKELLNYGSATYTEVLNAQQSLLSAQLSNVNDHLQRLGAVVSLYRALGGGWE